MMMKIAASTYLNSAPLVKSFINGSLRDKYEFIGDTAPWRCASMLREGRCEIALIPVIEYQRIPGLVIIPEVAVASKERVRSVILAARGEPGEAETVVLDTSSRTSQSLVKILYQRSYRASPKYIERTPDVSNECGNMFEAADAALVIGDPAMKLEAAAGRLGVKIYDLAHEWRRLTDLPFVFAVWAVREETLSSASGVELIDDFMTAKNEGIAGIDEIAANYAANLKMDRRDLLRYLRENVNFDLDEENIAGMRKYFQLAVECGLIGQEREIRFPGNERAQAG